MTEKEIIRQMRELGLSEDEAAQVVESAGCKSVEEERIITSFFMRDDRRLLNFKFRKKGNDRAMLHPKAAVTWIAVWWARPRETGLKGSDLW